MTARVPFNGYLAVFLAESARLAYAQLENDGAFALPPGYTLVKGFQGTIGGRPDWLGFIMRNRDRIVLAFRGSRTPVNLFANIRAAQSPYPFVPAAGETHAGYTAAWNSPSWGRPGSTGTWAGHGRSLFRPAVGPATTASRPI